jgi:flagella basal body P-ring formation protein FlgA
LSQLPLSILTDTAQVVGKTVLLSLPAGTVLKQEMFKSQVVIQQGQKVTVSSSGPGFRVSSEGVAMSNAAEGQVVQVRLTNQRVISGVAQAGGVVIVGF